MWYVPNCETKLDVQRRKSGSLNWNGKKQEEGEEKMNKEKQTQLKILVEEVHIESCKGVER